MHVFGICLSLLADQESRNTNHLYKTALCTATICRLNLYASLVFRFISISGVSCMNHLLKVPSLHTCQNKAFQFTKYCNLSRSSRMFPNGNYFTGYSCSDAIRDSRIFWGSACFSF